MANMGRTTENKIARRKVCRSFWCIEFCTIQMPPANVSRLMTAVSSGDVEVQAQTNFMAQEFDAKALHTRSIACCWSKTVTEN
jgi:hypothetical protein